MREDYVADIPQLFLEENNILTADFTEEEVFNVISHMELNKLLGSGVFPAKFYK
jgi:hypothetical protein